MPTAAVVGLNWGVRMHVPALREAGWDVRLLCGRNHNRTREAADLAGVTGFTTRHQEVWDAGVDLVAIALPWQLHADVYRAGLQSRSALLVEHPLSACARDATALSALAGKTANRSFVNFPTRFLPPVQELNALLIDRAIGSIKVVRHTFFYPMDEEREWLPLLVTHSLDLATWLFKADRPGRCLLDGTMGALAHQCPSWSWPLGWNGEPHGACTTAATITATLASASGSQYVLCAGQSTDRDFVETLVVEGTTGVARYETRLRRNDERSPWVVSPLVIERRGEPVDCIAQRESSHQDAWFGAHVRQATALRQMMESGRTQVPPASFSDGARVHCLLEQMLELAQRTVEITR
jgi:predicted dehydrogenase